MIFLIQKYYGVATFTSTINFNLIVYKYFSGLTEHSTSINIILGRANKISVVDRMFIFFMKIP